ncbi:NAD(P)-dependent oxidoreductase [Mesobacillus subterraneus]|uniref:NAD(P)-dependent oxidoreductase n=1 Tax=Mesobacillus subterraneus TaxID=285983 RepID=A0A3R9F5F4_9BACI|nr:NAD(P)-dependent oxidoreductase [Mesobacillus subterraneus]RSD29386.1 NAD(P)-dependent oxidoreductase [Mesobacillus subterraneus]
MEEAAIFGVYEYIGYSLCLRMLDLGMEVQGIHPESTADDYFTEEKRLEIGRNANFEEISLEEWEAGDGREYLFISLFACGKTRNQRGKLLEAINKKLEKCKSGKLAPVLILPANLAVKPNPQEAKGQQILRFRQGEVLTIYLPTVFGPWQPEESFFQQAMNCMEAERPAPRLGKFEWTYDALYIDDVACEILAMAESGTTGEYLLASGQENRWIQCAEQLLGKEGLPVRNSSKSPIMKDSVKIRIVSGNGEVSTGLSRQKEHYCRLQESRV